MDRSRSKRYYHDHQDYDSETRSRSKQRYNNSHSNSSNHHYNHRRPAAHVGAGASGSRKVQDSSLMVTTSYRILCHDARAGSVIGKSGSIIKAIRQHTGAWINVHELVQGDEERIIEITDTRRRDPEGRMPSFSPAQEALSLIHERILESDAGGYIGDDDVDYGPRGGGEGSKVATRLVVSRMHVGCLLGKGGKIIEQMKMDTKTHIRILPRDHSLPRCVALSEEIVQVVGDMNAVKKAMSIISSRLRESQHRDRTNVYGRQQSPELFFPHDDFLPRMNYAPRKTSVDVSGSRLSGGFTSGRSNNYNPRSSGAAPSADDAQLLSSDDLVFQILCPIDKVDSVVGESHGIIELLQNEIGVDVKLADPVAGSNEQIIIISSEEGPADGLFPAQEALLHIQSRIVDLVPEKENIITTRLVVPSVDIDCLDGSDGSLSEIKRLTGANIQILHREEFPVCVSGTDEIVQIVGEIKSSREALVEVTSRLRSYIYQEDMLLSVQSNNGTPASETTNPPANYQNIQTTSALQPTKDSGVVSRSATVMTESEHDMPNAMNRIPVSIVTRSILEVLIPHYAVPKLITNSKNKLYQISELSGASVKLLEDLPETNEKTIQISGTPEQAERAQSLLQGFILSTQEDAP